MDTSRHSRLLCSRLLVRSGKQDSRRWTMQNKKTGKRKSDERHGLLKLPAQRRKEQRDKIVVVSENASEPWTVGRDEVGSV